MDEQNWYSVKEASDKLKFITRSTLNRYLREWWLDPDERFPEGEVIRLQGRRGQFRLSETALLHFKGWLSNINRHDVSD